MRRRRKPDDPTQEDDPEFVSESDRPTSTFYEDKSTGKAHEHPETNEIGNLDLYLDAEVLLPQDGEYMRSARVIGRATDANGIPVGTYNSNPVLNTRIFNVMFPDGNIQQYSANIIAENIYSQVDEEGYRYVLLD